MFYGGRNHFALGDILFQVNRVGVFFRRSIECACRVHAKHLIFNVDCVVGVNESKIEMWYGLGLPACVEWFLFTLLFLLRFERMRRVHELVSWTLVCMRLLYSVGLILILTALLEWTRLWLKNESFAKRSNCNKFRMDVEWMGPHCIANNKYECKRKSPTFWGFHFCLE